MIQIDKKDELYKYLINLGVEDVDKLYLELAQNGRYKLKDVRQYFREIFQPSQTEELDEKELEKILDYYIDIKNVKQLNSKEIRTLMLNYKETKDEKVKEIIINSQLKDILYLCINYRTMHKDVDIQDVVQIANIGLLEAIEKFNPKSKIEFKDYMVYWIRERIIEEFKENK